MPDCHVTSYIEDRFREKAGCWRAQVVHTATGRVLYVTWPYTHELSAIDRARRWLKEEYARTEAAGTPLFPAD